MLFDVSELVRNWNIRPKGVLHVGAHKAEEWPRYEEHSWTPVIWVEGQTELVEYLLQSLPKEDNEIIQAYVWSESGVEKTFNVASNGQSSSLLEFGSHAIDYPEIQFQEILTVRTKRLDDVLSDKPPFDFVNIDLQGVELEALIGLGQFIHQVKWIYTEVNRKEVYVDCTNVKELDLYLETFGFSRVATRWCLGKGWGDALYVQKGTDQTLFPWQTWKVQTAWYAKEFLGKMRLIAYNFFVRQG
jgi:FkbM family methyltransferase